MLPDLTGYKLEKAEGILKLHGVDEIEVVLTSPPWKSGRQPSPESRVLKVSRISDRKVQLLVSNTE